MISIDGMRPDYVTQAEQHGLKVPTLRRFMSEGSWAEGVKGVSPTVTYPSHTTLVTGTAPAEHGIASNGPFDPMSRNAGGWYWYAEDVKEPTLWDAAKQSGLVTASVSWPVTVGAAAIRYNLPEYGTDSTDRIKALRAVARPDDLLKELEKTLGPYSGDASEESDAVRARFALEILKRYKPGFMTVHLLAVDHHSHESGPFSPTANAALESIDGLVAKLHAGVLANDPNAVTVVVSDHGFAAIEHGFNWRIPFMQAGLITLSGPLMPGESAHLASWKAAVWNAGGAGAVMLKDPNDTQARQEVGALLDKLRSDPHNGIARILAGHDVEALGGWPGASFVIDMQPGYYLGGDYTGAQVTDFPTAGQHGYLPDHQEVFAAFFVMGRGIAHGRDLGQIDMRQIAPTVARVLEVKLPSAKLSALDVLESGR